MNLQHLAKLIEEYKKLICNSIEYSIAKVEYTNYDICIHVGIKHSIGYITKNDLETLKVFFGNKELILTFPNKEYLFKK